MRILLLAPQPFFVQRGTPIAVRLLMETLAARGDLIDALVFPGGEPVEIPGCRIRALPPVAGRSPIGPGFSLRKLIFDLALLPAAGLALARRRYDLVIAVEEAGYIARLLSPVSRAPYLLDVDSSIPEQINDKRALPGWALRLLNGVEGWAARGALGALTCCRALEELIRGHAPGLPVKTVEDIAMLEPETDAPPPEEMRGDAPIVLYVGNLEPYQGVDLLLDGFARLGAETPARLVIVGGAAAHVAVGRARAEKMGLEDRVAFLGPRPLADLGRYLRAASIVASPRTQGRNTPMKVYSYLDSGRPLIATRLPTHTQVLDDEIAMLVEPEPEAMARGLADLLADPALRDRLAAAAGMRVRAEFSREGYARKLLGFLDGEIAPRLAARGRG